MMQFMPGQTLQMLSGMLGENPGRVVGGSPPATYECELTTGSYSGVYRGYDNGNIGTFGSIDGEPIPGETLGLIIWTVSGSGVGFAAFEGDAESVLSGLVINLNGTPYPFDEGDWSYNSEDGLTSASWTGSGPTEAAGTYTLSFE